MAAAIDDAFVAPDARLDDRTRAAFGTLIVQLASSIEGELRDHAARLLTARGAAAIADALRRDDAPVADRLIAAGLLRDVDFAGECLARVRLELLAAALPFDTAVEGAAPSLLARLARSSDRVAAAAAAAVLTGESARRSAADGGATTGTGLPHPLHARLVWWVAATIRERIAGDGRSDIANADRAIAEAALRNIAAEGDAERLEAAAMRLAQAIDAQPAELPALVEEALRDRRPLLFTALLARALGLDYDLAREMVIDPAGERLWLALRALDLPRDLIARIGFLLSEADPRRDVEAFADMLDGVMAVASDEARAAIAPMTLHPEFRAAMMALDIGGRRA
ncbi:DUF2336 domain-containing protein [Sphingomonas donggukensis]|uniref:DUF2336 domain-containing protein n=1 Tax=Sphingomonas donggukensis TaxID=2949093 RepID=A0ABY4TVD9_9SPHN|nr:DUF2336 domain-containing protein [Sphingomonas donggukensis]URW76358.1 DUF2336 domain-containing protein [Sphingomonas donggukensis]